MFFYLIPTAVKGKEDRRYKKEYNLFDNSSRVVSHTIEIIVAQCPSGQCRYKNETELNVYIVSDVALSDKNLGILTKEFVVDLNFKSRAIVVTEIYTECPPNAIVWFNKNVSGGDTFTVWGHKTLTISEYTDKIHQTTFALRNQIPCNVLLENGYYYGFDYPPIKDVDTILKTDFFQITQNVGFKTLFGINLWVSVNGVFRGVPLVGSPATTPIEMDMSPEKLAAIRKAFLVNGFDKIEIEDECVYANCGNILAFVGQVNDKQIKLHRANVPICF